MDPQSVLLMNVGQAAERLGLTEYQVRREHERGILPGRRAGRFLRFTEEDLATYVVRIQDDRAGNASGLTPGSLAHLRRQRERGIR